MKLKEEIMGALARGYCTKENENKVVDPTLCEAMANELMKVINDKPLPLAISVLCHNLLVDESYRISWVANIAMAYVDSVADNPDKTVHECANIGADRFLNLLCMGLKEQADE